MLLPFLTLLIGKVENQTVYWFLLLLMIWRGIGGGMSGLPWQEINARVIPITHRARFIGLSRIFGQFAGVLGSLVSVYLLGKFPYPKNYAIGFVVAAISLWFSYAAYSRNREPEPEVVSEPMEDEKPKAQDQTWALMKQILKKDSNFIRYLSRPGIPGNMASAFIAVYAIERFRLRMPMLHFTALLLVSGILLCPLGFTWRSHRSPKVVILSFGYRLGLVVTFSQSLWVYYIVFAAFGLLYRWFEPGGHHAGDGVGRREITTNLFRHGENAYRVFLLVAPILSGWLVQSFNYMVMFAVSCLGLLFWRQH